MNEVLDIQEAIANLNRSISEADQSFDDWMLNGDEWAHPAWRIQKCFLQLLALAEAVRLTELHKMILAEYSTTKDLKKGFLESALTPEGEPYSIILSTIRQFLAAIAQFHSTKGPTTITKDVLQILRDIHYTITDKALFGGVPKCEKDVHIRVEGILKCVFPDLKRKPPVGKPIKNFEPDTGIRSIQTLIEYKFLSKAEDVPVIADQILADTRGYTSRDSKEWNRLIFVIYETNRFRPEKEWVQLLKESAVPENTTVVVLSGEPSKKTKKAKALPAVPRVQIAAREAQG